MLIKATRVGAAVVMLALAIASLSKFLDLPRFIDTLGSWMIVPPRTIPLIGFLVPCFELALGGLWLSKAARARAEWLAIGFLVVVTSAYCIEWSLAQPPECGCLALLSKYFASIESAKAVLVRNAIMMTALLMSRTLDRTKVDLGQHRTFNAASTRGFTLVETILVVMLIAILVSLSLPSLARIRERGRTTVSLSNLAGHSAIATMYANDFKSLMPYATTPRPGEVSVVRCLSRRIAVRGNYFSMTGLWHIALADGYYDGNPWHKSLASPINYYRVGTDVPMLGSDYLYACSFLASPEYYNDTTHMLPPRQLRAVRIDEVLFPSAKFVFLDYASSGINSMSLIPTGFSDGHAAATTFQDDLMYQGGDSGDPNVFIPYGGHFPGKLPLPHTVDGVRGRDTR